MSLDGTVILVFIAVYVGMLLGRLPVLALDRTGVALLGSIVLVAAGAVTLESTWQAVDLPTIALLFGLMVISAQFRMAGFYSSIVRRLAVVDLSPPALLAVFIAVVGLLSALLANDIVCLAMTPVLVEGCLRRGLDPKPFLLALACAANIGSAATLIGNPQNMLIGQVLRLSFLDYLLVAFVPAAAGLVLMWLIVCRLFAGRWRVDVGAIDVEAPAYNRWQTTKGVVILTALVACFLFCPWPREVAALAAAGLLMCSRRMRSREMLGLVDWQLLVLFLSLFVVNYAFAAAGGLDGLSTILAGAGIDLHNLPWLFGVTVVLSNLVSNVPSVMLLLPYATAPLAGPLLALASTLAGNLLVVGSIANIIVIDQAGRLGVKISWREHARVGVPVTLATLAFAALWLLLVSGMVA